MSEKVKFYYLAYLQPILGFILGMYLVKVSGVQWLYFMSGIICHVVLLIAVSIFFFMKKSLFAKADLRTVDYFVYLFVSSFTFILSFSLGLAPLILFLPYAIIAFLIFPKKYLKTSDDLGEVEKKLKSNSTKKTGQLIGIGIVGWIIYYLFFMAPYKIERMEVSKKEEHKVRGVTLPQLGKVYITKKPLFALDNLPFYEKVSANIRRNAPTRIYADSKIKELSNSCINCNDYKRIITPLRISYIPQSTKLKIVDFYKLDQRGLDAMFNSSHVFVILKDENGKTYEILPIYIDMYLQRGKMNRDERKIDAKVKKLATLEGCGVKWKRLINFNKAFKFTKEEVKVTEIKDKKCGRMEFLDSSAHNTYLFYN